MTATTLGSNVQKLASTKEERKLRKPLIERKRRERINNCLDQLKETVVGAFRLDQSKLEKADILEMTVKHLQNIQTSKLMADSKEGLEAQQRYSTGYIQCMHEVHNLLLTCEWMDKTLGARLLNHLLKSLPRSGEDSGKATPRPSPPDPRSLAAEKCPASERGDAAASGPSPEQLFHAENKQPSKGSPRPHPQAFSRQPGMTPLSQIQQPTHSNFTNPSMASLDMWRPW
ncbi:transcription cofactor HES-6-like [Rhinatrema bivittatum]|uniref:transcription cofactor HES-6-like n=1 Tax=Rhinatrema bivittatum TaxID=194408 RepID=UPI00112AD1B5|nr:transcription cofactor HES-6-like [Rhinatrema bivittatum]